MIFITLPHPLTPSRKGRGDFHSLNPFPQSGVWTFTPPPLAGGGRGVGGEGLMKIAIYFSKKLILFLFRLRYKE
jgi:hypothetical protein